MTHPNSISELLATHSADLTWQREFYEDLHRHPELSHDEERTAQKIEDKLREFECELITGIGGYGMAAIFRSGDVSPDDATAADSQGPTVLMRADFDALPVMEQTGVDFASTNGNMHACGHDMHATALLGACAIIDSLRGAWSGTFIALFQPAEETSDGAKTMLADGLIDRVPRPDVCLGQHVMPGPAGQVQTSQGPIMAGCDSIRITIAGRSAHASMPDKAIDPTLIAAMIVIRLQAIVGREVPPGEFFVISVGELHSGDKNNIIPDSAELVLNTRYYDPALAERVYEALHRVVEAECVASASPLPPSFEYFAHGEVTDNDPATAIAVRDTFDAVFGDEVVDAKPSTASEDFCYLPQAWGVPYFFWLVGSTPEELLDTPPVNHQSNFLPDFAPTCTASTKAGAAAVLSFLAKA
ncbi:amidohydrolase [Corynebacterium ammoniagenes]|uniref:Amidohydrolase n=1 Tax=Corynebacterium ammoniagenes DSM 20306 TaxID=649754 RepID=A0ABN0AI61_CORAM|nr:amidohydrolase [Corynebacterium ammoniagenes]APT82362.1 metal-dependent amidase/aminoacylase/carboxypeptidase [Corynebacterium ammoniagenes DSM 20306]AQS73448.1 carboxypeptidase [Corynebacterium ammoniagenes]EFG82570.1 amidohydrolase [Corynebacterium ammoniagenes DSM 20306]